MAKITYTDKVIGDKWTAADANEVKNSVNDLYDDVDEKVDKVTGKGLSTEDFTTVEKTKLSELNVKNIDAVADFATLDSTFADVVFVGNKDRTGGNAFIPRTGLTANNGTVYAGAGGTFWQMQYEGDRVNLKWFGAAGDGVTDDSTVFNNTIALFNNIYISAGTYLLSATISASNKSIIGDRPTWNGSTITGGTVINGGFIITGSDVNVTDIGIINGMASNGFTIKNNAEYVNITNCLLKVNDHGILTQAFGGTCKNIRVLNCDAFGGIHGFVSKAQYVTYENCRSFGASIDGFAMVSDNFEAASSLNLCLNNNLINCEAHNTAIGITIYSRDYFSTTNVNNVVLRGLNIIGGNINTVTSYGILCGDEAATPGGQTYNDVLNIAIHGINLDNITTAGIKYSRCNGVTVMGVNSNKLFSKDTNAKNVKHLGINMTTSSLGNVVFNTVLTANATTPSIQNGDIYFETANTLSTTITTFANGKVGQIIYVFIKDNNTTINSGANITLNNGSIKGSGSMVCLKQRNDASGWDEVFSKCELRGSATYDPPSIANGAQATTTVTVTKAAVGDHVQVSFSNSLTGLSLTGYVSATDTVTAVFFNGTGAPVDLASGTLRAKVTPQ